jgi:outer membrane protein OmpA-like peptidoglycan-associated protein
MRKNDLNLIRRSLSGAVVACLGLTLAACTSAPPPPPPPAAPVKTVASQLADLGFEKTDEGYVLNLPGPLLFETGSDVLNDGAKAKLATLAVDLRKLEINKLRLFGHTDNVGTAEFNRTLSTKRAEAVAQAMSQHGFTHENLERRGFGFDRPLASNDTPEGRAKNRRVAIIVPFE